MNLSQRKMKAERLRRGIYVLPNLMTTMNIFCGYYAVVAAIDGKFVTSAVAIIIAAVFDMLDGKIARVTHTTSRFGIEFDSLADVISFGLAPGILMYLWALQPLGRMGWLAAFLFTACGALRLARFNTQTGTISSEYFNGLPIPAAAGITAVTVLLHDQIGLLAAPNTTVMLVMLYVLSFLMVSTVKYYSFKNVGLFRRMNFNVLVATVLVVMFIASQPSIALFSLGMAYLLSGPFTTLRHHRNVKREATSSQVQKPKTNENGHS